MNKMQVYFKNLHLLLFFFLSHSDTSDKVGFCFTAVFFKHKRNYQGCGAIVQSSRETIEPARQKPPLGNTFGVKWFPRGSAHALQALLV